MKNKAEKTEKETTGGTIMDSIIIRRPETKDQKALHHLFVTVLTDTFEKEGISDQTYDLNEEIRTKMEYLNRDLESDGKDRFFLIAELHGSPIGTIEYGPSSHLIDTCTKGVLKSLPEVGTVFVHPNYQRKGIGTMLLDALLASMRVQGIEEFCLDSGYRAAQQVWLKKFGPPDYHLQNFWGEGVDHMIWRKAL